MSARSFLWLAVPVLAVLLCATAGRAFADATTETLPSCTVTGIRTEERPDPPGVPTHVKLGVLVADVMGVDDVGQSATVDLIALAEWRDPRLAGLAGCRVARSAVWFPRVEIINSNQLTRELVGFRDRVAIGEGGTVRYLQRLSGSISTYHELQRFPFDRHQFKFQVIPIDYPAGEVVLELNAEFTRLGDRQNIADWKVYAASGASEILHVNQFSEDYSVFTLTIDLARSWTFYIWRLIFPMVLIVVMSFGVFWISPDRFGPQIGLSATAMLTLIAFQFFVAGALPKLSYFTILDKLIVGSTALVFLSLLQSILTANLVHVGKAERAHRIDKLCRWVFPLVFVLWWAVVLI